MRAETGNYWVFWPKAVSDISPTVVHSTTSVHDVVQ